MHNAAWQAKYVPVGDTEIAYYAWGRGAPLVLLHGNGEDSSYFARQIPVLSRFYRVLAVDSRGHGKSGRGRETLDFARLARDLAAVFRALGLEKASILGFSDGGNLAIRFALDFPQHVDKLILNGANIRMLTGVKPAVQLPLYPVVGLLRACSPLDEKLRRKCEVLSLMTRDYGVSWDDLRRISAKTLVLVGERDMIFDRHSWRMTLCLPHARMERIPGGDHFCAARLPNQFNLAVLRFLKEEDA